MEVAVFSGDLNTLAPPAAPHSFSPFEHLADFWFYSMHAFTSRQQWMIMFKIGIRNT